VGEVTINTLVPQADEHQAVPEGQAGQAVQEVAGAVAAKGAKPINAEATKLRKVIDKTISTKGAILEALAPVPSGWVTTYTMRIFTMDSCPGQYYLANVEQVNSAMPVKHMDPYVPQTTRWYDKERTLPSNATYYGPY
jgi:hypothetical protein